MFCYCWDCKGEISTEADWLSFAHQNHSMRLKMTAVGTCAAYGCETKIGEGQTLCEKHFGKMEGGSRSYCWCIKCQRMVADEAEWLTKHDGHQGQFAWSSIPLEGKQTPPNKSEILQEPSAELDEYRKQKAEGQVSRGTVEKLEAPASEAPRASVEKEIEVQSVKSNHVSTVRQSLEIFNLKSTNEPWHVLKLGDQAPVVFADDGTPEHRLKFIARIMAIPGRDEETAANADVIEEARRLHRLLLKAFAADQHTKDCVEMQKNIAPAVDCFCWRAEADIVLKKLRM